jgi:lysophospholipase L1-like esterase
MRGRRLAAIVTGRAVLAGCAGAPPEPPERIVYLALGASDAVGIGAVPITRGYVYRITEELDERVALVVPANLGIPGATADELDDALALLLESPIEPNLVTVWTGPNEVIRGRDPDAFESDLEDILDRLRARTDGVIAVANIPDLTELPRFRDDPDGDVTVERIEELNEAIAEQADEHDALLVDLHSRPVEDDLVSDADGFHPSNAGHRRIAELFLDAILPALGLAPEA